MQRNISFKYLAVIMIIPLIIGLMPSVKAVAAGSDGIKYVNGILSWDKDDSAVEYTINVQLVEDSFGSILDYQKTGLTTTSFALEEAMQASKSCPSGTYKVEVKPKRASGISGDSKVIHIEFTCTTPQVETTVPRFDGMRVEWDPVENAKDYYLRVWIGPSKGAYYYQFTKTVAVTGTSYDLPYDFVDDDLYYRAEIFARPKEGYVRSYCRSSEAVLGEYLRNGYKTPPVEGWYEYGGEKYYYHEGNKVTGWQFLGIMSGLGRPEYYWFYFDDNGVMQTDWLEIGGKWYFLGSKGAMATGWRKISGTRYYFSSSGAMQTGWQKISDKWYYFGGNGAMRKDWQLISGKWYYFDSDGVMMTGWQQIGGVWYYFKSSGAMASNEYCEGYWLNEDGSWTYKHKASWRSNSKGWWYGDDTGWYAKSKTYIIDGRSYTFDANGYWNGK